MLMPVPTPDLLLARRAAAGQAEAWDEILDLYGERLYNLAFQFAGSSQEAEDLTQEIFLRLYQNLRLYRGDSPLVAWTLRLSRNLCIDHYRRMRQERRSTAVSEEVLRYLPASDDVQAEAQNREELRAVYLEVPLGTVKSRLHRARLELAERVTARFRSRWESKAEPSAAREASC